MSNARIVEVADGVVARINTVWAPVAPNTVSRQYELPMHENDLIVSGRQVWVFPDGYLRIEPATRASYLNEYRIRVVIAERYADAAGPAPTAWLDARLYFVASMIVDALDYAAAATGMPTGLLLNNLWTESIEVVEAYAHDLLAENKLFFSEVIFAFREIA